MAIYRGYEVGDDEETEGKKAGVDAILADKREHETLYYDEPIANLVVTEEVDGEEIPFPAKWSQVLTGPHAGKWVITNEAGS